MTPSQNKRKLQLHCVVTTFLRKVIKPTVNEALVFLYILAYTVSKATKRATITRAIPAVNVTNIFICKRIIMREKFSYLLLSRFDPDLTGEIECL